MIKKKIPSILLFTCCSMYLLSQAITGRVTDSKTGVPLIGATIQVLESDEGTSTNENGEFELSTDQSILISYIGYESQTVRPTSESYLRILLVQNTNQLGEVVVSAYNKKSELINLAAPVSIISESDLERADNTTIIPLLNAVRGVKLDY